MSEIELCSVCVCVCISLLPSSMVPWRESGFFCSLGNFWKGANSTTARLSLPIHTHTSLSYLSYPSITPPSYLDYPQRYGHQILDETQWLPPWSSYENKHERKRFLCLCYNKKERNEFIWIEVVAVEIIPLRNLARYIKLVVNNIVTRPTLDCIHEHFFRKIGWQSTYDNLSLERVLALSFGFLFGLVFLFLFCFGSCSLV